MKLPTIVQKSYKVDKVVHLIPSLNYGGTEKMLADITRLQVRNYKVYVIVFSRIEQELQLNNDVNIFYCLNCYFQRRFQRRNLFDLDEYNSLIESINPTYIHSHSYYTDIFMLNGYKMNASLLSHWHLSRDILDPIFSLKEIDNYLKNWLDKIWYMKLLYNNKVGIILISDYSKKHHLSLLSQKLYPQLYILKNAIKLKNRPLKVRNINFNKIKLISVGRLEKEKNHIFLIRVMKKLSNYRKILFSLDIYGAGRMRKSLNQEILKNDLQDSVSLKGNIEDLGKIWKEYHLYLHASLKEQFGLTILEALNAAIPCISLDHGAVNELIINGKNGFLIEGNDPEAFMKAIIKTVSDPILYQKLSKNAFEVSLDYNINDYIIKLNTIYKTRKGDIPL